MNLPRNLLQASPSQTRVCSMLSQKCANPKKIAKFLDKLKKIDDAVEIQVSNSNVYLVKGALLFALAVFDALMYNLYTTRLSACLNDFNTNASLRNAIAIGIDILYIDDTVFTPNKKLTDEHPTEFQLKALIYLVRPKKVVGYFGTQIPSYILKLCRPLDL